MSGPQGIFGSRGSARRWLWILALPVATLVLSWILSSWFPLLIFGVFVPVNFSRVWKRGGPQTPDSSAPPWDQPPDAQR